MTLRLGAHVGQQNMSMDAMRALWRRLDQHLDWISAWDHLYEAPPQGGILDHYEALSTLGALAADTTNVRIGVLVMYVGYRTPGVLAKAATTIDHISGGRFELGLGSGWHEPEARAFGYEFPSIGKRQTMLDEACTIIRSLLTTDRTTFDGRYFKVEDASCLPRPVQERLPIWIGGQGARTVRQAATLADGFNAPYVTPDRFRELCTAIDQHCHDAGRDPASVRRAVNLGFYLSTTQAHAAQVDEQLRAQWGVGYERITGGGLLGMPDRAVERILEYVDAGAQDVNVALRAPWDEDALTAYLDEVVPAVRKHVG